MSIVERGTFNVDSYAEDAEAGVGWDSFEHEGNYYINTNPGMSFLAAPAWGLVYSVYSRLPEESVARSSLVHHKLAEFVGFALTSALAAALTAALIFYIVFGLTKSRYRAAGSGLLYAFGTIAFPLSQGMSYNQNVVIAAFCVVLLVIILMPQFVCKKVRRIRWFLIGFVGGLAIFVDLSIAPFLLVMVVPLVRSMTHWKQGVMVLAGALPPLVGLSWYLESIFGNPFLPPQAYLPSDPYHTGPESGLFGLTLPRFSVILDHLTGLRRGLFLFMPFTVAAFAYGGYEVYRRRAKPYVGGSSHITYMLVISVAYLLFAGAAKSSHFAFFGPRYLLPAIPFLCIILGVCARRAHAPLLLLLSIVSLWINIGGAQIGTWTSNPVVPAATYAIRGPWFPILTWIQDSLVTITSIPRIITPFGLLAMLLVGIIVIWAPHFFKACGR